MKKESKALVKEKAPDAAATLEEKTAEENEQVKKWSDTFDEQKKKNPKYQLVKENGIRTLIPKGGKADFLTFAQTAEILGTADGDRTTHLIHQLTGICWGAPPDQAINTALATLHDIAPKDPLETLLAVQMLATHNVAVEMLRRALLPDQTADGVDADINRATKLLRTFTAQMETLNRHRGKGGEQRVIVQHVNVSEGGQAIVGNVTKGPGGTGE